MQQYLHITPSNNAEGILQDMHWSDGSFGYFPSYLLGSIYDGMFLQAIEHDLGSIDELLAAGRILEITHWLNEKIHRYGGLRLPKDVLREVCHEELSAQPLLTYFREKIYKAVSIKNQRIANVRFTICRIAGAASQQSLKNIKAFLKSSLLFLYSFRIFFPVFLIQPCDHLVNALLRMREQLRLFLLLWRRLPAVRLRIHSRLHLAILHHQHIAHTAKGSGKPFRFNQLQRKFPFNEISSIASLPFLPFLYFFPRRLPIGL